MPYKDKKLHHEQNNQNTPRLICPQDGCIEKFPSYRSLRCHLNTNHSVEVESENIKFDSIEDFKKWKDMIQQQSLSFYTLDTAPKKLSQETEKQYFNCHRSYIYNPKGKNIRHLKSMGSSKIGKACPSRMEVTITYNTDGSEKCVMVQFWRTHCGHAFQLGHMTVDKESRAVIAGKLKEGVSFNYILDSIRDNESNQIGTNQRLSLIERKDLHNIVRDYNIEYSTKRHQNDAVSVKLWVEEMQGLEDECPVLYYKGQDEEDSNTLLENKDFILIIVTMFQCQQLIKFGKNIVCIDGTHGTNAYDIQLYTIMIVDEFGNGCPVAYCFSNRCDEYIFSLYFMKLKEKVGILKPKVFMSDDSPAFYNAWVSVMGHVENKLLCIWHIDRNWRLKLSKIQGGSDKIAFVYKTLRVLLQLTSVDEFNISLNSVLKQLFEDDSTKNFGEYFQNHYAHRPESWAYCYRLGLGINTNMYLESYHKILKYIYLEGRKAKRLDKTISAIIKIARDSMFKRLIKLTKNSPTEKSRRITRSHALSQSITPSLISVLESDKEWLISSTDFSKKYHVSYIQNSCLASCLTCDICKICIHSFKCSCTDNLIKLNICKHIHACAQQYFKCSSNSNVNNIMTISNSNEIDNLLDMCQSNVIPKVQWREKIIKKAELIIGLSNNSNISEENSVNIEKYLDKVISILNKNEVVSLDATEDVNVQKKIDKQQRLYSTKKKKVLSHEFQKPSYNETDVIRNGLLNSSNEVLNIHCDFDHSYAQKL